MQIVNNYSKGNFTIVPNDIINSTELSLEAKGLLAYLISKPEDFKIKVSILPSMLKIGVGKFKKVWREICDNGYIESTKMIGQGAVINWSHKVVLPEKVRLEQIAPQHHFHTMELHTVETHPMELHSMENRTVYNNTIVNKKENKKDNNTTAESDDSEFEKFWNMYDKKIEYKKCLVKWRNITKKNKKKIFETLEAYVRSKPDKQYRKNPLTYLNGECWNDEIQIYQDFSSPNNQALSSAPSARQTIVIPENF